MSQIIGNEIKTPWGLMAALVDVTKEPVVIGAAFSTLSKFLAKSGQKIDVVEYKKDAKLAGVTDIVNQWIEGDLNAFKKLKVRQPGGDFMQACWKELRKVKGGTVVSYAQLAVNAGRPAAVRAAGSACAKTKIAVIIPCHRIIKSGGAIGAYGWGVNKKIWLLKHEGALD